MYRPIALDDRDDGDEEHDADRDADEREEALELLHADLGEGEADGFEERHVRARRVAGRGCLRCTGVNRRVRPTAGV